MGIAHVENKKSLCVESAKETKGKARNVRSEENDFGVKLGDLKAEQISAFSNL